MARRGVDRLGMARGRAVAAAVVRRAEMRAALQHLARNADRAAGAGRSCRLQRRAARVLGNAAGLGRIGRVLAANTSRSSIPRRCRSCRARRSRWPERRAPARCARSRRSQVLEREVALPGVGHVLAARRELVAPGELGAVQPAARGELPFGLGRQLLAGPCGVGLGIAVGDLHHRMIVEPADVAALAVGPPPVGAEGEAPPLAPVAQVDGLARAA